MAEGQYTQYVCANGDMWDSIAYRLYGDEFMLPEIMKANRAYARVLTFEGGEVLSVPVRVENPLVVVTAPFSISAKIVLVSSPWNT